MKLRSFEQIAAIISLTMLMVCARADESLIQLYGNSASRIPFVVFTARSGAPGHAFIAVGEELDNGLDFELGVYGFYPKEGKKYEIRALFKTDGELNHKWKDMERDVWFEHKISAEQRDSVLEVLEGWKDKKYSLLGNNCNTLAKEVAQVSGLQIPSDAPGATFPVNYISKLQQLNNK